MDKRKKKYSKEGCVKDTILAVKRLGWAYILSYSYFSRNIKNQELNSIKKNSVVTNNEDVLPACPFTSASISYINIRGTL